MKRLKISFNIAVVILVISCYFDMPRDNPNDPRSSTSTNAPNTEETTSSTKSITSFTFDDLQLAGEIDQSARTIVVTASWKATITSMVPTIIHTGESVSPSSGVVQDFSNPVSYTVTAEDGSTQVYVVTVTVIEYNLRDTGPAGGLIFYINPNASTDGWKYLECAPASTEWSSISWGANDAVVNDTSTAVGTGKANTQLIVPVLDAYPLSGKAAQLCDTLEYGGFGDWFLPSQGELVELYNNLHQSGLGDFKTNAGYLSSSEYTTSNQVYGLSFNGGTEDYFYKANTYYVRAIRFF